MRFTLSQIAHFLNAEFSGDPQCPIEEAASFDHAGERQITFAEKGSALKRVARSNAAAVIVPKDFTCDSINLVQVDNPRLAFAQVLERLHPPSRPDKGAHPSATIGEGCQLGKDVAVAAGVVIGNRVNLGDRVVLYPNVVLGDDVTIGDDTIVYPLVSILERCQIGSRVIIHSGTVIGGDGFGFVFDKGCHRKIPQIGYVQIDDDVEIGANNTIDRGTLGKTWIKTGVKTDNLVHIAHNVVLGEHSVIVAQVGIAGSTTIGRHAIIAGQAGIGGHLTLGNEVTVGPRGAVAQSVPDKQVVSSVTLAMPHGTWLRLQKVLPNMPELQKKVRQLEKKLAELEQEKSK